MSEQEAQPLTARDHAQVHLQEAWERDSQPSEVQEHFTQALIYAVLDLADAVRELKPQPLEFAQGITIGSDYSLRLGDNNSPSPSP